MMKLREIVKKIKNFVSNTVFFILRHSNIKKNYLRNENVLLRMFNQLFLRQNF